MTTESTDGASAVPEPALGGTADLILHARVVRGSGGGPEGTIFRSAPHAAAAGYRVAAAYMHPPGDPGFAVLERRARAHGCRLIAIPDRGPLDARVCRKLLAVCREGNARVWHGHDYKSNLLGLLLRPFHPMRLVTTVHGWVTHAPRTRLYYAIDRFCLRRYERVMTVSPDLERSVRALGVPAERCSLIPNGVDESAFRRLSTSTEDALRSTLAVPRGRAVIGTVGRLSGEKGFENLIDAVCALLDSGRDVEAWIAGEGPERAALEARIAAAGLGGRVRLLGYIEDPAQMYRALDVFALPSVREGLPNALLEAMASGLPVVATRVAGVPSVVDDGRNGLLCAPGDASGLAADIARVLTDPGLAERMATAARRTVEERFPFASRMRLETQVYDRLLRS